MMNNPSIINSVVKALPAFSATARSENLFKASLLIGIPKKSISRYIFGLEQYLERPLFIRQRGKLILTPEGEKLYDATSSGLSHIISTLDEITEFRGKTILVIGCPQELLSWLSSRLKYLKQLIPYAEIELITIEYKNQTMYEGVDIIFTFGMEKFRDVDSYLLFKEEVFPVCSPAVAERFDLLNRDVIAENLFDLPLIHGDWDVGMSWQNWFTNFGVNYHTYLDDMRQASSYLMSLEMAKNGDGIALAWTGIFQSQLNQGLLVALTHLSAKSHIGYYMNLKPESPLSEVAKKWWRLIS